MFAKQKTGYARQIQKHDNKSRQMHELLCHVVQWKYGNKTKQDKNKK